MVTGLEPSILVVGSVAFDSVETSMGSVEKALGGSATFASLSASYYARPRVVAVVGDDFTDEHFAYFRKRNVDTGGIEKVAGKTFHWRGRYHDDLQGRDTLETALNVFEGFNPTLPDAFDQESYVFLGNIDPSLQMKVIDQSKNAEFVGMDTMNFWIESALDELKAVLKKVDMVFINDDEAFQLSGEKQVLKASEKILDLGPKYVVIKRGEFGSLLFGRDICLFVPAVLLPSVVDPTGAGDAFAGGFMGYLAGVRAITRANLASAMIAGTVMASYVVEKFSVDGLTDLTESVISVRRDFLKSMTDYS